MGFNQDLLNDISGIASGIVGTVNSVSGLVNSVSDAISGANGGGASGLPNAVLRDYTHAAKTFRTNSYQYAPKLKFLFHTYFQLNTSVGNENNFGLLVKEIKLPQFSFANQIMNQYNRKRIVQTKIKYEPIEISFHDDNGNQATRLWEAYYQYYYNDSTKPGAVLSGPGAGASGTSNYNDRNIYRDFGSGEDDWGFIGGQNVTEGDSKGVRVPFFKNITVFGFNQHNFTAYTLINPVINSFGHDTYNYAEGGGTMTNRMTIDYETVVYNYGAMDGRNPGNIVTGFGDSANYDTLPSPIVGQGQGTILGQGGLVDAAGGAIRSLQRGDIAGAISGALSAVNTVNQLTKPGNNVNVGREAINALYRTAGQNPPRGQFNIPVAGGSPGPAGLAGALTIGASVLSTVIKKDAVQTGADGTQRASTTPAGKIVAPVTGTAAENRVINNAGIQYAGNNLTGTIKGFPPNTPFNPDNRLG